MKARYVIRMEVVLEGKTLLEIEDKFFDLDLGKLEEAKTTGEITHYDYEDTEVINMIETDGSIGKTFTFPQWNR